jgi:8-oxo-dGTP pyrophosphatase MutT (NUDIX family)
VILRLLYPFAKFYWRLFPKVSLGTRVFAIRDGKVLLVRMTYLKNWYFPGGGVDRHESLMACAAREIEEETGWRARTLTFEAIYFDSREKASNHVALFRSNDVEKIEGAKPDMEIAEIAWFPLDALPAGLSPATKRRIDEYLNQSPPTETW